MFQASPYKWVSIYYFGFFFTYGVYLPFWALWFEGQGISPSDVGLLVGIGFATRCISNVVFTPRIHKVEHLLPALRLVAVGCLLFIGFHFFTGGSFWMMAVATILFNFACGPVMPLADSLANHYDKRKQLDYGRTRLWGSIAFIVGSLTVGYLTNLYGIDMIVLTALVGMLISVIVGFGNPNPRPESDQSVEQTRPAIMSLLKEWPILRFLILVSLIQGSHAAYYGFSSIYWRESGHGEDIIGYLWSLGVVAEIMVFWLSKKFVGKISIRTLFMIASVGVMIRWGLTASTTHIIGLIVIQLLHGVTFAMAHVAAIRFIQNSGQNRVVALQALLNAIPLGAVLALLTSLSGWGYEAYGSQVFWAMAAMGLVALMIKVANPSKVKETLNAQN